MKTLIKFKTILLTVAFFMMLISLVLSAPIANAQNDNQSSLEEIVKSNIDETKEKEISIEKEAMEIIDGLTSEEKESLRTNLSAKESLSEEESILHKLVWIDFIQYNIMKYTSISTAVTLISFLIIGLLKNVKKFNLLDSMFTYVMMISFIITALGLLSLIGTVIYSLSILYL